MKLRKNTNKIILHTAAFEGPLDAIEINDWHIARGFTMIGYHFVITGSKHDETCAIEYGRPLQFTGAHAKGSNYDSVGICVTGHGDKDYFTMRQIELLNILVFNLCIKYDINTIIGHRETWLQKLKPKKTCPGSKIHMDFRRAQAKYMLEKKELLHPLLIFHKGIKELAMLGEQVKI